MPEGGTEPRVSRTLNRLIDQASDAAEEARGNLFRKLGLDATGAREINPLLHRTGPADAR